MAPRTNPVLYFLQQIYTIQCTRLAFRAQQPNLVCFPSLIPLHWMPRHFHPVHPLLGLLSGFRPPAIPAAVLLTIFLMRFAIIFLPNPPTPEARQKLAQCVSTGKGVPRSPSSAVRRATKRY